MIALAKGRYIRVSPIKIRQVIDLIRGKNAFTAVAMLTSLNKGCSKNVLKILNAAVNNAKQKGLSEDQVYISKIYADQGPVWKRYRSAPFGRANGILKKTAHLTIELDLITK
jgi:large subunit ribosomal protein L22